MKPPRRALLAAAAAALLAAGCGFRLRGAPQFSYRRLHLGFAPGSGIGAELRRQLRVGGQVELVDAPKDANVVLRVLDDAVDRHASVTTAAGQVREIHLRVRLRFMAQTPAGRELIPATELALGQDMSFTETAALAKESEEALMVRTMQADIAAQLLRRLAAAHP
ncbi:LPS assembly lipoprotein LptE [Caldimonas tepidiphila]|uniref:LPS-assembly lipoprotein LptE n=1 Tax=Caldimonas tepidiphila TaxID=2315841 RepID=UPI000E5B7280|nr:LPS assembly lipoprotein LptE [Caldimonas tepidiphila]